MNNDLKSKDVIEAIFKELGNELSKEYFYRDKRNACFSRNFEECENVIDFNIYKKKGYFEIEVIVGIRVNLIQRIFNEATGFNPPRTIGMSLDKLILHYESGVSADPEDGARFLVEEEGDIPILANALKSYFHKYILRYFRENSSVERVDALLNEKPDEISIHCWLYPLKACIAIIAAKLSESARYEQLVKKYGVDILDATEEYQVRYNQIVNYLSENGRVRW